MSPPTSRLIAHSVVNTPQKAILDTVQALFLSKKWSDMEILCGDYTFPAHQIVVFPRSEYFVKACSGSFGEPAGRARLDSKDPFLMEKVLEFLYKGSYSLVGSNEAFVLQNALAQAPANTTTPHASAKRQKPNGASRRTTRVDPVVSPASMDSPDLSASPTTKSELVSNPAYFHARMYAEGDFFMIQGLKNVAMENFEQSLKFQFRPECFLGIVKEIYSMHADYEDLKKAVTTAAIKNLAYLRDSNNPILDQEVLASLPGFAEDLCMAFILKHGPKR